MAPTEILSRLVIRHHVSRRSGEIGPIMTYFDEVGGNVPFEQVWKASEHGRLGEVEFCEPKPGVGYYAHLHLESPAVGQHGYVTRYLVAGPDWSASAIVTEPAAGGLPDVVVEDFDLTFSAARFLEGVARRF